MHDHQDPHHCSKGPFLLSALILFLFDDVHSDRYEGQGNIETEPYVLERHVLHEIS
jgi:hypothetical protein